MLSKQKKNVVNKCAVIQALLFKIRFSIILNGPRTFGMVNENWLQLKVTSCISP